MSYKFLAIIFALLCSSAFGDYDNPRGTWELEPTDSIRLTGDDVLEIWQDLKMPAVEEANGHEEIKFRNPFVRLSPGQVIGLTKSSAERFFCFMGGPSWASAPGDRGKVRCHIDFKGKSGGPSVYYKSPKESRDERKFQGQWFLMPNDRIGFGGPEAARIFNQMDVEATELGLAQMQETGLKALNSKGLPVLRKTDPVLPFHCFMNSPSSELSDRERNLARCVLLFGGMQ